MIQFFKYNLLYIQIIVIWLIAGYFVPVSLFVLVPAVILYLYTKQQYLILFLGFWLILIFSDARGGFESTSIVKIIYLFFLLFFIFKNKNLVRDNQFYKPFLVFLGASFISLIFSPVMFTALQKTISYFLIIFIVPGFVSYLLKYKKTALLYGLVYTGALILIIGFLMLLIDPEFAIYAERFSGVFGNPNGLGIFCILYTLLWFTVKFYYPKLFSRNAKYFINLLILAAVYFSASRGALLAIVMIWALDFYVRKKNPFVLVGVILVGLSFFFIENIVDWLYSVGLGEYLRAQTLEAGGGRIVAYEFAWEQIKLNPFFGRGFGYSEYWFHLDDIEFTLNMLNHQGNTHNSYLTVLMDTGFIGLILFLFAWGLFIAKAIKRSPFGIPVLLIILFSSNVEAWLAASLNPFTIILIIILTLLSDKNFYSNKVSKD